MDVNTLESEQYPSNRNVFATACTRNSTGLITPVVAVTME